jgi:hypothetical protein
VGVLWGFHFSFVHFQDLVGETSQYNLRYSTNLQIIPTRTSLYAYSFVPSTLKE